LAAIDFKNIDTGFFADCFALRLQFVLGL